MKAMLLSHLQDFSKNNQPLELVNLPMPVPGNGEILVKVSACGVCHTELDEIEGRTPPAVLPVVLGHQVVGRVAQKGPDANVFHIGERVGIAWIFSACGKCAQCLAGYENLCSSFRATGRDANGGYAEFMLIPETSAYRIPSIFTDSEAAPLLCAGAIGYRSLRLANLEDGQNLGLSGFGASAHLVLKLALNQYPNSRIYVFSRSESERLFASELGAAWTGDFDNSPPEKLDAVIDTTPVWKPVVDSMRHLNPGGRLVINAIRKEELDKEYLLKLDYSSHLWMEKEIKSVANITRQDVHEFLDLAAQIPIKSEFQEFRLEEANRALFELKSRQIRGAKVLVVRS